MPTKRPEVQRAHWAVSNAKRAGRLVKPTEFQCHDCPEQATQYDHYLGYEKENRLKVQPVCASCHMKRAWTRGEVTANETWREGIRQRMLGNQHGAGHPRTPEHKLAISRAKKGKPGPMLGRRFTEEHRAKISASHLGKILSAETRAKISRAKMGTRLSAETKAKIGAVHRSSKRSVETKAKMAEARRLWWAARKAGKTK